MAEMTNSVTPSPWRLITNGDLVLANGHVMKGGSLLIVNGRIRELFEHTPASLLLERDNIEVIDASGCWVTPGLIDQHINGAFGTVFNTASPEAIRHLLQALLRRGVTGIVPTLITAPKTDLMVALSNLEEIMLHPRPNECRLFGIHLEGPFLNPDFRGAHPAQHMLPLNADTIQGLASPHLKMITLAPELDPDGVFIRQLRSQHILCNLGHSGADFLTALSAINAGARCFTHLYNAMGPFHHRQPGILNAAWLSDRCYVELIADGLHVSLPVIELTLKIKSLDNVILISDANGLVGASMGDHAQFGQQTVTVTDKGPLNQEGHLAGSTLLLPDMVKNLSEWNILPFPKAVQLATVNPARHLGELACFGQLHKEAVADIVLWHKDTLTVDRVLLEGQLVIDQTPATAPG